MLILKLYAIDSNNYLVTIKKKGWKQSSKLAIENPFSKFNNLIRVIWKF